MSNFKTKMLLFCSKKLFGLIQKTTPLITIQDQVPSLLFALCSFKAVFPGASDVAGRPLKCIIKKYI